MFLLSQHELPTTWLDFFKGALFLHNSATFSHTARPPMLLFSPNTTFNVYEFFDMQTVRPVAIFLFPRQLWIFF